MRVVIAEKPSVAKAIRSVVPEDVKVTFCFGHLLKMAEPEAYDPKWKAWSPDTLPIRVDAWKVVPCDDKREHIETIRSLLRQATEVTHAGDPDREGQLLVDELLEYLGWRGATKRMLATDLNPGPLKKAWENRRDNAEFKTLKLAAESRQRADWLVGMNMTRAATKLIGDGGLISVGRVQTPTLALVVRRHKAIAGFQKQSFFTLVGRFALPGSREITLRCEPDPRIVDAGVATRLAASLAGAETALRVTSTAKVRKAPLPFDLGSFQRAAEKHFGMTLDAALEALQKAYEAGWTSYPRSDCRYLPTEHKTDAVAIAKKVAAVLGIAAPLLATMTPRDAVYDSSKVTAHYAIVPTNTSPSGDDGTPAFKAWKLVSMHYLTTLMPDERYLETAIEAKLAAQDGATRRELVFKQRGETVSSGVTWRSLDLDAAMPAPRRRAKTDREESAPLPIVRDGERATCRKCASKAGETTPPKLYTPASLRDDMEDVAKFATDAKMKAILKETHGIGTSATRAETVKKLLSRGFIVANTNGTLDATGFGVAVIDALPGQLSDPVLTAAWEKALGLIAEGKYDPGEFSGRVVGLVDRHLDAVRQARNKGTRIKCPSKDEIKAGAKKRATARKEPSGKRKRSTSTKGAPRRTTTDSVFL